MDQADVEEQFAITPAVPGELAWDGGQLVFTPDRAPEPGARYTISVIGAHDAAGNVLGGKGNFSFIVQPGAQVTKTRPEADAVDAEPPTVELWFSQPMDVDATNTAFALTDTTTGALVGGHLNWNAARTQLVYAPDTALRRRSHVRRHLRRRSAGRGRQRRRHVPRLHHEGRRRSRSRSRGRRRPCAAPAPAPVVPPAAPATSLAGYALNQVNAARAAYGFGAARAGRRHLRGRLVARDGPGRERLLQPLRPERQHQGDPASGRWRELRLLRREPVLPRWA